MNEEYIKNGGRLFQIRLIDHLRDGGTGYIATTDGEFFIDAEHKYIYDAYPTSEEHRVTDSLLINYLIDKLESHIKREEEQIERNKILLSYIITNKTIKK